MPRGGSKFLKLNFVPKTGLSAVVELKIGYDGIVIASKRGKEKLKLSRRDLFLALARDIPDPRRPGRFIRNPYKKWRDVNESLPDTSIRVLGPPPTSGTRDAFVELAMEGGCKTFPEIKKMKKTDKHAYRERCHTIREDGHWIEAGENDNLIIRKLVVDKDALGIFGFSFLQENRDKVQGALIEGFEPDFENISSGDYPVSRSLYIYTKKAHIGKIAGLEKFLISFMNKRAMGESGYLVERGLIPLPAAELDKYRQIAADLTPMSL